MGYPGRRNIYEATIRRMINRALEEQDHQFLLTHRHCTDQQLLDVLKMEARRLGHTPWPGEIPGAPFFRERFGTWERALALAGLEAPRGRPQPGKFARYQEETARQRECYRLKRAEKRERLRQQAASAAPAQEN